MHHNSTLLFVAFVSFAVLSLGAWMSRNERTWHKRWATVSLLHPLATAVLFGTLAFHMHQQFGGWPDTIGTEGFSSGLLLHANLTQVAFGSLLLVALFCLPIASIACQNIEKARPVVRYLALYGLTAFGTLAATYAAPKPFLEWWWD